MKYWGRAVLFSVSDLVLVKFFCIFSYIVNISILFVINNCIPNGPLWLCDLCFRENAFQIEFMIFWGKNFQLCESCKTLSGSSPHCMLVREPTHSSCNLSICPWLLFITNLLGIWDLTLIMPPVSCLMHFFGLQTIRYF